MRLGLGLGLSRGRGAAGATGILDAYTGAAFAFAPDTLIYGTHSVTDNEVGSVTNGNTDAYTVRVRRSSDNAVSSFTYSEVSDGTLVTWVGVGNDGLVEAAYDQSGNDNHATQSTATNQPKIVDNGVLVVENGKAAMDFDGANDWLKSLAAFSQPFTYFVASTKATSSQDICMLDGDSGTNFVQLKYRDNVNRFIIFAGGVLDGNIANNNQNLHYALYNGLNSEIALNDGVKFTGNAGANDPTAITIGSRLDGSGQFWNDKIQFISLYPSDQSANRTGISNAINNEYNIY